MTAREPSAVEVIAEELRDRQGAVAVLAALKAAGYVVATPEQVREWPDWRQAELLGGYVWGEGVIPGEPPIVRHQVRGPWREATP